MTTLCYDVCYTNGMHVVTGNEGTGLSKQQQGMCDGYVYIPQYGTNDKLYSSQSVLQCNTDSELLHTPGSATASLNVHIGNLTQRRRRSRVLPLILYRTAFRWLLI